MIFRYIPYHIYLNRYYCRITFNISHENVAAIYVDEDDIAMYTIKTIDDPRTLNKTLYLRPPQNNLSQREVVEVWEKLIGKQLHKSSISKEEFLATMKSNYQAFSLYTNLTWMLIQINVCLIPLLLLIQNSPKLCRASGINPLLSCLLWGVPCQFWNRRWGRGGFSALSWNQLHYCSWIHEKISVIPNMFALLAVEPCNASLYESITIKTVMLWSCIYTWICWVFLLIVSKNSEN